MSYLRCLVRLYLQLFVGGFMSYLRCLVRLYLQLFVGGFISYLRCLVRLYLQLFVGGFMSYLRCLVRLYPITQTAIYKTLHRKQKIDQHESNYHSNSHLQNITQKTKD